MHLIPARRITARHLTLARSHMHNRAEAVRNACGAKMHDHTHETSHCETPDTCGESHTQPQRGVRHAFFRFFQAARAQASSSWIGRMSCKLHKRGFISFMCLCFPPSSFGLVKPSMHHCMMRCFASSALMPASEKVNDLLHLVSHTPLCEEVLNEGG